MTVLCTSENNSEELMATCICISNISLTKAARLEPTCPLELANSTLSSLNLKHFSHQSN